MAVGEAEQFFTTTEAAEYLGYSRQHMANLRKKDRGPVYFRGPGKNDAGNCYYMKKDLDAWRNDAFTRIAPTNRGAA